MSESVTQVVDPGWSTIRCPTLTELPGWTLYGRLVLGIAATLVLLAGPRGLGGAVFVTAFVVCTLVRQLLLRLRAGRRRYSWRRSEFVAVQRT